MSAMAVQPSKISAETIEAVLVKGDLSSLKPAERVAYYQAVCESVGLNPITQPFAYINLNGKLTLYAKRDCTDQLRKIHGISINIPSREVTEGCYVVTAQAKNQQGRADESLGAVPIDGLKGEARSNAMMKAETKAKRRVTLSICGLAVLDESEISSIPGAEVDGSAEASADVAQRKIVELQKPQPAVECTDALPAEDFLEPPAEDDRPSDLEDELRESILMVERMKTRRTKNPPYFQMLEAFGTLKSRYKSIGMERTYYAVLGLHGVQHSNEFPNNDEGLAAARSCFKELSLDVSNREVRGRK